MSGLRLDLHVHSRHSPDSSLSLPEIVGRLGEVGLDGFALTDHNTVAGHAELDRLARQFPRYRLIPGVEVSTQEGHLLVLGTRELPPLHGPVADTIEWARARGAVPIPAHPFRWVHGIGRARAESLPVPALEARNGHTGELANARAELLAARRGIGATGGSDAHERRDLGRAFTELPEAPEGEEPLLELLRSGRCLPAGSSLRGGARLRVAVRTGLLRVARGFRSL